VFRKFSNNAVVNLSQLTEALTFLSLTPHDLPQVTSFFESLRGGQSTCSLDKLLIAGVLLGRGADAQRAETLFEIYDVDSSHSLASSVMRRMVNDLYAVVVLHLPALVSVLPSSDDTVRVMNYIEQIKFRGDRGKDKLLERLTAGRTEVSSADFKQTMASAEYKDLLRSWGVRDFFFKVYKVIPASYHQSLV
jgi:Ca2+-binding EF-hand superfamily protein